jgi:D-alanyl-D-alanine carboxypeptidase/D-alanyl-D-alanine-endopeptidase (penicillin-binding protein 4)
MLRRHPIVAVVTICLLITLGCGGRLVRRPLLQDPLVRLREQLQGLFAQAAFGNAFWGVLIQSADTGEEIFSQNQEKSLVPASNMKLFTTAVALLKLGPEFRYQTRLYGLGEVDDEGTLQGSLLIEGSGDPTISGRFTDGKITATFEAWAESLTSRGIRKIAGDIIGDDDIFDDQSLGPGWAWDYQTDWYAAQISGLSFNDNCVDISIVPGEVVGDLAQVKLNPISSYVTINNALKTCLHPWEQNMKIWRHPASNHVDLTGSIALEGEGYEGWITVDNPTLFAATVLKEVLIARGILVAGQARDIDEVDPGSVTNRLNWLPLASVTSPPITEIIKVINKRSQNYYAEQLLKTLGAHFTGKGSFAGGIEVVKETLAEVGISPGQFIMVDGSGLSRHNFCSPRQVVTLLSTMARHSSFTYFRDSLPIAGVDGTIGLRMRGTTAQEKTWAKTGYVDRVRALSGYVYSLDGELIIFSMMVNNYTVPTSLAEDVQDRACQLLASFSRRGTSSQRKIP